MRRIVLFLFALLLTACAPAEGGGIDVIDVSGPLDASALEFMADSVEAAAEAGQVLAVLQINSKAVLDGPSYDRLVRVIQDPPLPVAVWVGPAPAAAYGGASVLTWVPQSAIAPGSTIGLLDPAVLGDGATTIEVPSRFESWRSQALPAEDTSLELQPTLRQYLQDLDGRTFHTRSGQVTVSTLREMEGGVTLKNVTFREPGLATRFFRLAVNPEAAFLFLVVGLTIVTFEFYALGPGVAAGVGALSLILGGWGMVNLPVRWWAVALAVAGWLVLTAAHQKGGLYPLTLLGASLLQAAGIFYLDGSGQIDPRWWLVLPAVLAVLFFYLLAMPTVQRARLSTRTIGRDSLIGRRGKALVDFDPDGLVEVDGARWRATAHREAGLVAGAEVVVTGVDGLYLEVDKPPDRENS